jgi:hypothetical protein
VVPPYTLLEYSQLCGVGALYGKMLLTLVSESGRLSLLNQLDPIPYPIDRYHTILYEDDCRPKEQKYPDYIVALSVFISGS